MRFAGAFANGRIGEVREVNTGFADIHSHILPGIDDGSQSVEESLRLLRASAAQGVGTMVATPHFYARHNTPENFLAIRAAAREKLARAVERAKDANELPRICCGAEVAYFSGLGSCEQLPQLCIEGTNVLLLEMPFCRWSDAVWADVLRAKSSYGLQIVVAHIERYIDEQPAGMLDTMLEAGMLIQANAESFLSWRSRFKALRRLKAGKIHFIASDCHNMERRPPNIAAAAEIIEKKCGRQAVQALAANARVLIEEARF